MSDLYEERVLAEVQDQFGLMRVLEVDDYRFFKFGEAIEQSCVFTRDPRRSSARVQAATRGLNA